MKRNIQDICSNFGGEYWREKANKSEYLHDFVDTLTDHGWMGILVPEEYGGAGMGTRETVTMMEEIAAGGGGFSAAQAIHGGVYNSVPITEYASEEMRFVSSLSASSRVDETQSVSFAHRNAEGSEDA
ncbi:Acyl-CoA dehydrogenase (plasmid) [Natrarchaeobaculum sulfurireducens]|uniref:Acyl-CoA dehydrogenase n=1 Tax=Natrarchaeobaculum sulfurireducens TaxID=2044521 RepID=A0A346PKB5_9EURY|nr:Acyl-CoA dehydrogenase [Natrarchaeobaculum sulfurireducens]